MPSFSNWRVFGAAILVSLLLGACTLYIGHKIEEAKKDIIYSIECDMGKESG